MNVFFGSGIANGGGQLLGGSAPATPLATLLTALTTAGATVNAVYNIDNNLTASAAGLTSWIDARGSGGPDILPLGAAGGGTTGPKLIGSGSAAVLKANGVAASTQWAGTAAFAAFGRSKAQTFLFVGELPTGNGAFPVGMVQALTTPTSFDLWQTFSSATRIQVTPVGVTSPRSLPASGTRIALALTKSGGTANSEVVNTFEMFGRGANFIKTTTVTAVDFCLQFGGYTGNTSNCVAAPRFILHLDRPLTSAMRAAIEVYLADATAGHQPSMTPTTHFVDCIGDSIVFGQQAVPQNTTSCPAGPVGAGPVGPWPDVLQDVYNTAGKSVDVRNAGIGGRSVAEYLATSVTQPICIFDQLFAAYSAARVAAGFRNIAGIYMGTNDLPSGRTAAQIYADMTTAIGKAKATGVAQVVIGTILPRGDLGTDTLRLAVNTLIRGNTAGADLVVDFSTGPGASVFYDPSTLAGAGGSDTPGNPTTSSTYYYTDKVHLINGGYFVVQQCVKAAYDAAGWTM